MKRVKDYHDENQLRMFRFSCFNNASVVVSAVQKDVQGITKKDIVYGIFDLAEQLYEEGVKRDYLELKENDDIDV